MISLDARMRQRLVWACTLASPVIGVQAVRVMSESELSAARGAVPVQTSEPPTPEVAAPPLTPKQIAAMKWAVESAPKLVKRSPMERPEPPPVVEVREAHPKQPAGETVNTPIDDRPTHLRLTGMLTRGSSSLAAIDGALRQVGDEVAPGWRIRAIDTKARAVTLAHADRRTHVLTLPLRGGEPAGQDRR